MKKNFVLKDFFQRYAVWKLNSDEMIFNFFYELSQKN